MSEKGNDGKFDAVTFYVEQRISIDEDDPLIKLWNQSRVFGNNNLPKKPATKGIQAAQYMYEKCKYLTQDLKRRLLREFEQNVSSDEASLVSCPS